MGLHIEIWGIRNNINGLELIHWMRI